MKRMLWLTLILLSACAEKSDVEVEEKLNLRDGDYLGVLHLNDSTELPFNITFENEPVARLLFKNAEEVIEVNQINFKGDSVIFDMPVFKTGFRCVINNEGFAGDFIKYDADDYTLSFEATFQEEAIRFKPNNAACCDITKKWKVTFQPGLEDEYFAIGEFDQNGNLIRGTFMTETGDYRFLEGVLDGNNLKLSGFDGNNLYRFDAVVYKDSIQGVLHSGRSGRREWVAIRDDSFELKDAESLTYLKEGYDYIEFKLPLTKDSTLIFDKSHFDGKVVILQILGSWCPNCMDESRFLQKMYEYYQKEGLVVIGLAFERKKDMIKGFKAIEKMGTDLNLTYPIGFAGSTSQEDRVKMLPQLNKIMSFPTTIFIDKNGNVRKIHTGFNGPGTSVYDDFTVETNAFIQGLLKE